MAGTLKLVAAAFGIGTGLGLGLGLYGPNSNPTQPVGVTQIDEEDDDDDDEGDVKTYEIFMKLAELTCPKKIPTPEQKEEIAKLSYFCRLHFGLENHPDGEYY